MNSHFSQSWTLSDLDIAGTQGEPFYRCRYRFLGSLSESIISVVFEGSTLFDICRNVKYSFWIDNHEKVLMFTIVLRLTENVFLRFQFVDFPDMIWYPNITFVTIRVFLWKVCIVISIVSIKVKYWFCFAYISIRCLRRVVCH